jgi:ABC-type dipeptide/oligopeptide/nickel transport system permease component
MLRYILRRLLTMIPLLIIISGFIFVIGQYGTGDLAAYLTEQENSGRFNEALYLQNRQLLHLDQPVVVRYGQWLIAATHGDLGTSYVTDGRPSVSFLISQALPITLQISLAALALIILVGIPLGILAAITHNSPLDYGIVGIATILSSVPLFVLAPLSIFFLVIQVHIIPTLGIGWNGLFNEAAILPVIILAANSCLTTVRFTRASVLEVLAQEYIRGARAKGLAFWRVVLRHVVKNSLIPVLSVVGLTASYLFGGSLFLEVVFNIQGFGMLAFTALQEGDIQTMTGVALVTAVLIMLTNLLTDILYSVADPRVQVQA